MRKGVLGVATLLVAFSVLYWHYVIGAGMPLDAQFSYFVASCAVICMALGMFLATRPRFVETSFGGLDRMYKLHKHLGVAAMLLYVAHFVTVPGAPEADAMAVANATDEGSAASLPAESAVPDEEEEVPIDLFGLIAMIGFTSLIVITLNRKIPYHRWITTHRLMGLCYSVLAIHVGLAFYDGGPSRCSPLRARFSHCFSWLAWRRLPTGRFFVREGGNTDSFWPLSTGSSARPKLC